MFLSLIRLFTSRLLLPVIVTVSLLMVAQLAFTFLAGSSGVNQMTAALTNDLSGLSDDIGTKLTESTEVISGQIARLESSSRELINTELRQSIKVEEENVKSFLFKAVMESAASTANVLATVSPRYVYDQDGPALTELARYVDQNPGVLFVFFLDGSGQRLTRYVDRADPKIKSLQKTGEGGNSFERLMDAAKKDPTVHYMSVDINPSGAVIGQVILGVDMTPAQENIKNLGIRFDEMSGKLSNKIGQSINEESENIKTNMSGDIQKLLENTKSNIARSVDALQESTSSLLLILTILPLVSGIIVIVITVLVLGKTVLSKIEYLRNTVEDLAEGEGDLTQRIKDNSKNEIGDLAGVFDRLLDRIHRFVKAVDQVSDQTRSKIKTMSELTERVQVSTTSQLQQLNETTRINGNLNDFILEETGDIKNAFGQVDSIRVESGKNVNITNQVRAEINNLVLDIKEATDVVSSVSHSSSQISEVLEVINGIAEQTNLLALNAAIEAARAGEQGRGFAVVADEVRALASKTQASTETIRNSIEQLQQGSSSAVEIISKAAEKADKSISSANQSDELMAGIGDSIGELHTLISHIAANVEQQQLAAEETKVIIQSANELASENQTLSSQNSEGSIELTALSSELKNAVGQFKI